MRLMLVGFALILSIPLQAVTIEQINSWKLRNPDAIPFTRYVVERQNAGDNCPVSGAIICFGREQFAIVNYLVFYVGNVESYRVRLPDFFVDGAGCETLNLSCYTRGQLKFENLNGHRLSELLEASFVGRGGRCGLGLCGYSHARMTSGDADDPHALRLEAKACYLGCFTMLAYARRWAQIGGEGDEINDQDDDRSEEMEPGYFEIADHRSGGDPVFRAVDIGDIDTTLLRYPLIGASSLAQPDSYNGTGAFPGARRMGGGGSVQGSR